MPVGSCKTELPGPACHPGHRLLAGAPQLSMSLPPFGREAWVHGFELPSRALHVMLLLVGPGQAAVLSAPTVATMPCAVATEPFVSEV